MRNTRLGAAFTLACLFAVGPAAAGDLQAVGQARPGGPATSQAAAKIVSRLRGLIQEFRAEGITRGSVGGLDVASRYTSPLLRRVDDQGRVQVVRPVADTSPATLAALRQHDLDVEIVNDGLALVQGWIPVEKLEPLAAEPVVQKVAPPSYAVTRTGSVTSQGDGIHRCNAVRRGRNDRGGIQGRRHLRRGQRVGRLAGLGGPAGPRAGPGCRHRRRGDGDAGDRPRLRPRRIPGVCLGLPDVAGLHQRRQRPPEGRARASSSTTSGSSRSRTSKTGRSPPTTRRPAPSPCASRRPATTARPTTREPSRRGRSTAKSTACDTSSAAGTRSWPSGSALAGQPPLFSSGATASGCPVTTTTCACGSRAAARSWRAPSSSRTATTIRSRPCRSRARAPGPARGTSRSRSSPACRGR